MKKLLSLLLALSLSVSLLGGSVLAADVEEAPFELAATLDQENKTVTLSLRTTGPLKFGSMDFELTWPEGFSLTSYANGSDYSAFKIGMSIPNQGQAAFISADWQNGSTVDGGKEFLTYTLDASAAAAGDYTFSITFNAAADAEANPLPWQGATITSNEITITEEAEPEPVVATIDFRGIEYAFPSQTLPYRPSYQYMTSEMIYDKSIIAVSGTITSLAFYVTSTLASGVQTTSLKIYMGTTDKSAFTNYKLPASERIAPENLTLVYEGSPVLGQNEGWETLELTYPFQYKNSENLVIFIYRESEESISVSRGLRYATQPDFEGTNFFAWYSKLSSADMNSSGTYNWSSELPYLQLTFAPGACTHEHVQIQGSDNGDGTHTVTKTCADCEALFTEVTEEHNYDWLNATLEGSVYTAACPDCGAETSIDVSDKALLQVKPAATLDPGKVYVITDQDSTYAMSVESSLSTTGAKLGIRYASPVTVVQDGESQEMYVIFDDEDEKSAGQWDYLEEKYLRGHNDTVYLYAATDSGLSLPVTTVPAVEDMTRLQWTYDAEKSVLYSDYAYPREVYFFPDCYDGGSTNIYGTSYYFCLGAGIDIPLNLYEVVGAHAHIWDDGSVTTEPTCTKTGVRTYTCTVEGCTETKTATIPATGEHTWDDGVVTQEATTAEEGIMTYTCTVCGKTKTEPIPVLKLNVTVEVHKDYVGGCSLILVYGGAEAKGYLYDGNAMYRTPYYDDTQKGAAFAYIVAGEVTEQGVLDVLTEAEEAAEDVSVSKIYDVNGTGIVDISDVQAVADCYNYNAETDDTLLAAYMAVYLRADVNKDYQVNEADANLVLQNRT